MRFLTKWLILIFTLALLNACGGGSDEPSNLFDDTGGDVGGKPIDTSNDITDITMFPGIGPRLVESGGRTTISFRTIGSTGSRAGEVAPNIPLNVTLYPKGVAKLENVPASSDHKADFSFSVSHPGSGTVSVNISGGNGINGGFELPIYFGASVAAEIISGDNIAPADGVTPTDIEIIARDAYGNGIPNISVGFVFPLDSFAVPNAITATNEFGATVIGITNTVPQRTKTTPFAGGMTAGPIALEFTSGQVSANPTTLDLIVKSNNVRPDGTKATLIVIARDDSGFPVPYVPVSISSNSATAQLNVGGKSNYLFINGNTGEEGSFELDITNSVAETVNVTVTTNSGGTSDSTVITVQQEVIFSDTGVGDNSQITTIELDQALNSPQLANDTDPVYLRGRVLDQDGKPIAGQTVTIIVSGGSANIVMDNDGKTDNSGRFMATLTDKFPEQFTAKAVAGSISSGEVEVSFTGDDGNTGFGGGKVTLLASPTVQIADGESAINLTAIVRDDNNTPLKDIQVSISASSSTAIFDKGTATTGEGGTATFSLTNTSTENVIITANAQGSTSSTNVRFIRSSGDVTNLNTNVIDNNQLANGSDKIRIDVVAKDGSGNLIGGVPITIRMSSGIAAKAEPTQGITDNNGLFFTDISSSEAGSVNVTIATTNLAETETIAFQAVGGGTPDSIDVQVTNNGQLANGEAKINLVVIPRDANNNPLANTNISLIGVPDTAIEPESGTTNELGKFFATVTSTREQQFDITAVPKGLSEPKGVANLIFRSVTGEVKDLNINVVKNHQLATGQDADSAQINVIARDENGLPVSGVPINVQLLSNPAAIVKFESPFTDTNGLFTATITSTFAGDIPVKITMAGTDDNISSQQRTITFIASNGVTPAKVDIDLESIVQPTVNSINTLLIVPRDENNAPIPNLEISLDSNSPGTITFEPESGTTNSLGEFRTQITNSAIGTVEVTATAKGVNSDRLPITFDIGVGSLVVTVFNDNQAANGVDIIEVRVVARDNAGMAVANVPIAVQLPSTAAVADTSFNEGKTDANGFFKADITSTVPGEIAVTISVNGTDISAPPKLIKFRTPDGIGIPPNSVELVVSGTAVADGQDKIDLIITPRDSGGNPLAGVAIELLEDSNDVIIEETTGTTNALGEFRTTVTTIPEIVGRALTEAIVVNITPIANGIVGDPVVAIFTPPSAPRASLTLTVSNDNPQLDEDVTITISARDENGFVVKNIPIRLRAEPVGTPDVSGSVVFGNSEGKTSEDNGIFTTTIRNSKAGTVKVIATMLNRESGEPIEVNSSPINVTFQAENKILQEVTEISLITDSPTLKSEGKTEGIILTAIVKNKDNLLIKDAEVNFDASSGNLQLVDNAGNPIVESITDENGRAYARLTTVGNADNRDIKVSVSVASKIADPVTDEKTRTDEIIIQVVGTTITISGSRSIVQFEEDFLTISLRDSDNKPISNQLLQVTSDLNNALNSVDGSIDITTDANGQAIVVFTANNPGTGEDIVKVSKPNAPGVQTSSHVITISDDTLKIISDLSSSNLCPDVTAVDEDTNNNGILDIDPLEDVNGNGQLDLGCRVLLNQEQAFEITWQKGGISQTEEIKISATRGILSNQSISMQLPDTPARFTIRSDNAGPATIIINGNRTSPPGPTLQFEIKFIADEARFVNVQANPSVIGTNPVGSDSERSEVLAVVRDPNNNLVADKQVNFSLNDISGGRLTRGSAFTDDFGRATTEYIAGSSSTAANGVQITASVADNSSVTSSVSLTVAEKDLFVVIGAGNKLEEDDGRRYKLYFTVLVTDSNGTPVADARVFLSIYPLLYIKSTFLFTEDDYELSEPIYVCNNEDVNRNGILDSILGEDINNNGSLEPANVVTVDNLEITTDSSGFADFKVVYPVQYAGLIRAEITARTEVAGTESSDTLQFNTSCSIGDVIKKICPVSNNPFGIGDCSQIN